MSSMQSQPDDLSEDRTIRLPAHATTVTAEDLRIRLVLGADLDGAMVIDASEVESVGQAALQILVAARREAEADGHDFEILNPSPAFLERVSSCCLADTLGFEIASGEAK